MNPGMDIFRRYQRLQGGASDVRYTPVTPTREYPYGTDYEFIHRKEPPEQEHDDEEYNKAYEAHEAALGHRMGPKDVYKTIGININGQEMEVPAVFDNMSESERNLILSDLPASMWPRDILSKIENNARDELEQGHDVYGNRPDEDDLKPEGHARGTSNIGLSLFRKQQQLKGKTK
jgi:hypothetical protein